MVDENSLCNLFFLAYFVCEKKDEPLPLQKQDFLHVLIIFEEKDSDSWINIRECTWQMKFGRFGYDLGVCLSRFLQWPCWKTRDAMMTRFEENHGTRFAGKRRFLHIHWRSGVYTVHGDDTFRFNWTHFFCAKWIPNEKCYSSNSGGVFFPWINCPTHMDLKDFQLEGVWRKKLPRNSRVHHNWKNWGGMIFGPFLP